MATTQLNKVLIEWRKKLPGVSISLYGMNSCCSAAELSGYVFGKVADEELLKQYIQEVVDAASETYSFIFATLIMPNQEKLAATLVAAGFEESQQIARSNHYNGQMPLRVFIRSMRPMTTEEAEKKIDAQKKKSKKDGYDW